MRELAFQSFLLMIPVVTLAVIGYRFVRSVRAWWKEYKHKRGHCRVCGYDLRSLGRMVRCPECGGPGRYRQRFASIVPRERKHVVMRVVWAASAGYGLAILPAAVYMVSGGAMEAEATILASALGLLLPLVVICSFGAALCIEYGTEHAGDFTRSWIGLFLFPLYGITIIAALFERPMDPVVLYKFVWIPGCVLVVMSLISLRDERRRHAW